MKQSKRKATRRRCLLGDIAMLLEFNYGKTINMKPWSCSRYVLGALFFIGRERSSSFQWDTRHGWTLISRTRKTICDNLGSNQCLLCSVLPELKMTTLCLEYRIQVNRRNGFINVDLVGIFCPQTFCTQPLWINIDLQPKIWCLRTSV